MGILSWLKSATIGGAAGKVSFAPGEEHFHGLNMKDAIDAHLAWKARLKAQLEGGGGEMLEVGQVASDDQCALGKWLHGEARQRFSNLPEYIDLLRLHSKFHLDAGKILIELHKGNKEIADTMLHGIDFRNDSDRVQLALVRLYAAARDIGA
jgi:hypothetical protein